MKKSLLSILILMALAYTTSGQQIPDHSKTDLLIKFKPEVKFEFDNSSRALSFQNQVLDQLNREEGIQSIQMTGNKKLKNTYCLGFDEEKDVFELIAKYKATDLFEIVEPNYIGRGHSLIPNDPFFFRQYGMVNDGSIPGSVADADIDMDLAWEIEQGDESVVVAVLDSGLKMDHPEFEGRLWINEDEVDGLEDTDGNGYRGDYRGYDFAYIDNDPSDDHGHGTNVAGIMGATGNNGIGYAGIDWNCKVMILKILDEDNWGLYTWWTDAIYYAVNNGARVLNMSVGGTGYSQIMLEAANYALANGVTIVVSAGNQNSSAPSYPAAYESTIAVGSTDSDDQRSEPFFWNTNSGSNFGEYLDVVAPGNFIYGLHHQVDANYTSFWGGTSQAAPVVSGIASLLLAQDRNRTPDEIRTILRSTAEDEVGDPVEDVKGFDIYYGHGRVNAYEALTNTPVSSNLTEGINELLVYPNPSKGLINVEMKPGISRIDLFNVTGEFVETFTFPKGTSNVNLDLSEYSKGLYFIKASHNKNRSSFIKKVLLQH